MKDGAVIMKCRTFDVTCGPSVDGFVREASESAINFNIIVASVYEIGH